jgi:hypothetical protein
MTAPVVSRLADGVETGIAVSNLESVPVTVNLQLLDEQGTQQATGQVILPPNGHHARFLKQLFPSADLKDFLGSVSYSTTGKISSTILQTRSGQLATMPAYPSLQ